MRPNIIGHHISLEKGKRVTKIFLKLTVRATLSVWRIFPEVDDLPKNPPRAHRGLIQNVTKEPRWTFKKLEASLALDNGLWFRYYKAKKRKGIHGLPSIGEKKKTLLSKGYKYSLMTFRSFEMMFCGSQKRNFFFFTFLYIWCKS